MVISGGICSGEDRRSLKKCAEATKVKGNHLGAFGQNRIEVHGCGCDGLIGRRANVLVAGGERQGARGQRFLQRVGLESVPYEVRAAVHGRVSCSGAVTIRIREATQMNARVLNRLGDVGLQLAWQG